MEKSSEFLWFAIEDSKEEWDALLEPGYEFLFNSNAYLMLNKYKGWSLVGIVSKDQTFKVGGLCLNNETYEVFIFPANISSDLLTRFLGFLREAGIRELIIHSYGRGVEGYNDIVLNSSSSTERIELVADKLYYDGFSKRSLHNMHRRTINKLEKDDGIRLCKVKKYFAYHLFTSYIGKIKRKPYLLCGVKGFISELLHAIKLGMTVKLREEFVLYSLIDKNNKRLSYALLLESGSHAYYMLGASTTLGYTKRASVYLMWLLLNEFCTKGIEFNMGGVNLENSGDLGVYRFKKQFGLQESKRISVRLKL